MKSSWMEKKAYMPRKLLRGGVYWITWHKENWTDVLAAWRKAWNRVGCERERDNTEETVSQERRSHEISKQQWTRLFCCGQTISNAFCVSEGSHKVLMHRFLSEVPIRLPALPYYFTFSIKLSFFSSSHCSFSLCSEPSIHYLLQLQLVL